MGFIGIYFEWGLFVLMAASGIIYLIDQRFFYKKRKAVAESAPDFHKLTKKQQHERIKGPVVTDYARSLFWVFVLVLILRSFVFSPYVVPSGSMLPTIQLGDFILVNKFTYGLRLPVVGTKVIGFGEPKRGDVVVFKNPANPQVDFIKTVIGVPGDKISYINKKLFVNGTPVSQKLEGQTIEPANANLGSLIVKKHQSDIGGHIHTIFTTPTVAPTNFKNVVVPKGEYFMMGDNRDNSDDSRIWGFVPEQAIVGKAWMIFFSFNSRTHHVRWDRIGLKMP